MEGLNIKIIIMGVLMTLQLLFGCPHYLHCDSWFVPLAHHFFHANLLHLTVNCLSIWTLFRKGHRYKVSMLVWAYLIGTTSWFFTSADIAGFSNIIFALIGLRTPSFTDAWWRHPSVIVFFGITALMALLPQVSGITHIVSFVLGCVVAGACRIADHIRRDFSRATYR